MTRLMLLVSIALATFAGCGGVLHSMHSDHTGQRGAAPSAPRIEATLALTLGPTNAQLTAYLCPALAAVLPMNSTATAACRARGAAPSSEDLAVNVHVDAAIVSNNPISLRASSALFVITFFPGAGAGQAIGAVCLTLCDDGTSACAQTNEACHSSSQGVVELGHIDAARDFASSVAVAEHRYADLAIVQVPAHGQATLSADIALASRPLLDAIQASDAEAVAVIRSGHQPAFVVPYALEGTIWVEGRGNDGFAEPITRTTGTIAFPTN